MIKCFPDKNIFSVPAEKNLLKGKTSNKGNL
jgi:hypothetical protein